MRQKPNSIHVYYLCIPMYVSHTKEIVQVHCNELYVCYVGRSVYIYMCVCVYRYIHMYRHTNTDLCGVLACILYI